MLAVASSFHKQKGRPTSNNIVHRVCHQTRQATCISPAQRLLIDTLIRPAPHPTLQHFCLAPPSAHTPSLWLRYAAALWPLPSHTTVTDVPQQAPTQPRPYPGNNYLPNGAAPSGPVPGAVPLLPNQGRVIQQGSARVLCVADVRGALYKTYILCSRPSADGYRQPPVAQPAGCRRAGKLHHPHWRLRFLR